MNIGIIGLGLIGGSMAKAIKENTDHQVFGYDMQESVVKRALLVEAIDGPLDPAELGKCQLILIALYPQDTLDFLEENQKVIGKDAVVVDCCGVKQAVCGKAEEIAAGNGFVFMGGHPMAGLAHGGFGHAKKGLFKNASMILTPARGTRIETVQKVKNFFTSLGFTDTRITTPREHDQIIAFTSQLAHVVSSAYIQSPTAISHKGFSAGSYKDMTRVAKLNEEMWTELFLDNDEFLAEEIDMLAEKLKEFSDAIKSHDSAKLCQMLRKGREAKLLIDGERF